MVTEYVRLTADRKIKLTMLTSDVAFEFKQACVIQHQIYCRALRRVSSAKVRKESAWWAREVNRGVGHHMGWLAKAQSRGILRKRTRGGGDPWVANI